MLGFRPLAGLAAIIWGPGFEEDSKLEDFVTNSARADGIQKFWDRLRRRLRDYAAHRPLFTG